MRSTTPMLFWLVGQIRDAHEALDFLKRPAPVTARGAEMFSRARVALRLQIAREVEGLRDMGGLLMLVMIDDSEFPF